MPWAHLPVPGPVVPHSGGFHPMVPRQGAALPWHRCQISLAGAQGPVWVYMRRWDVWMAGKGGKPGEEKPL